MNGSTSTTLSPSRTSLCVVDVPLYNSDANWYHVSFSLSLSLSLSLLVSCLFLSLSLSLSLSLCLTPKGPVAA